MIHTAHVDESSGLLPDGKRIYAMCAVLSTADQRPELERILDKARPPKQAYLHWMDERPSRRLRLAELFSACELTGAIITTQLTTNTKQEAARKRILRYLLPVLEGEKTGNIVIESRHQGDRHDEKVISWLRKSKAVGRQLRVNHVLKSDDSLLWLADAFVSAYTLALTHAERAPWQTLDQMHCIDVQQI